MIPPSASVFTDNQRNEDAFIGCLEVSIHQARDIHNICIYQKQDVYVKLCLTDEVEKSISSHVVNGGGSNPVFNETLKLGVRTLESSLRCEVWMLSRIRNYLDDQLLGFVLVPLSDIIVENGKLAREFQLSGTEGFHSQSGSLELSSKYTGYFRDVILVSCTSSMNSKAVRDLDLPSELNRIEFPDPKLVIDNEIMVSEYTSFPCEQLEVVKISDGSIESYTHTSSAVSQVSSIVQAPINVEVKEEEKMVQDKIVDLYVKSMKEFTDALEKMKLPMDKEVVSRTESRTEDLSADGSSQKVFYGSQAFF